MDVMNAATVKKKVMLISPNFGGGGAERSIAKLSILLSEKGYDVHFVIFNVFPGREQVYPISGSLHLLNVPAGKSYIGKAFRFLHRVIKVNRLKRKLNIDVGISFLEGADYVNILSRRKERVIISIRGSKENDEEIKGALGWLRKRILMPWLYKKADHIVCVSEGIKQEIERSMSIGCGKTSVINNYYDVKAIRSLAREPLPHYAEGLFRQPCIITSGRLHPQKNHAGLINSFAYLKKLGRKYKLVMLGDGELKSELISICARLRLSVSILKGGELDHTADVFFLGYQENPWIFVSRARIFVLSSSWEGFPNALAEAMCLGLPVISTDCPHGPREILSDDPLRERKERVAMITEFGALMPVLSTQDDCKVCADLIERFLSDSQLCAMLGKAAESRIKEFSADRVLMEWQKIM
jgi:glycosyltransferase involved in cell wall biosynthesis